MTSEWIEYRRQTLAWGRISFLIWPITTCALFTLVNWIVAGSDASFLTILRDDAVYAWTISGLLYFLYAIAYALLIALDVPQRWKLSRGGWFHIGVSAPGMVFGVVLSGWLCAKLHHQPFIWSRDLIETLFISSILGVACFFWGGYVRYRHEYNEAQCLSLQGQMNPHFLFNSFNSLTEAIESGCGNAAEMTLSLSQLYREILESSKRRTSSLDVETSIVRKYLELEKMRLGDRLRFNIELPEFPERVFLPSLVAQTLVENAIKHGIAQAREGGELTLRIAPEGGRFRLSVINTGKALEPSYREGTGLSNARNRLNLLYGEDHGLDLRHDKAGTVVTFLFNGSQSDRQVFTP